MREQVSGSTSRGTTASLSSLPSSRLGSSPRELGTGGFVTDGASSRLTFGHDGVICGRIRKRAIAPEQLAAKAEAERLEAEAEAALSAEERALRDREELLQELGVRVRVRV